MSFFLINNKIMRINARTYRRVYESWTWWFIQLFIDLKKRAWTVAARKKPHYSWNRGYKIQSWQYKEAYRYRSGSNAYNNFKSRFCTSIRCTSIRCTSITIHGVIALLWLWFLLTNTQLSQIFYSKENLNDFYTKISNWTN